MARFSEKVTERKICVLFSLQPLPETFLIKMITKKDTGINVHRSSSKVTTFRVIFQSNFSFLEIFSRNSHISNFVKIRQWKPSCLMRTDRQRPIMHRVSLQLLGALNLQVYLIGRLFPAVVTSAVYNKHVSCRFHRTSYPSSGVHKTVTTASHIFLH